jgi:carbon storage regulator
MLALSRRVGESITIDGGIEVLVVDIRGDKVRLGINAPRDVSIDRTELIGTPEHEKMKRERLDRLARQG